MFRLLNLKRTSKIILKFNYSIDFKNMSPLDVEKELFRLKRTMGAYYSRGQYNEALVVAQALESEVVNIWGSNTAVHASCMVDVGTMLKSLGEFDEAMELYQKALPLYQQYYGKNNKSYINTLTNIGTLYKSIAETKKEENEYLENINHAEINLAEALSLRKELAGPTARDVLINENHYAMILKAKGLLDEALEKLNQILEVCMTTHGELDTITAITQNNIGIILKSQKKYDEAEEFYSKAYKTRKDVIGERHRDTIITLHNLAELYAAKGETEKSNQVRQEIMTLIGQEYQPENWSDENIVTSLPSTVRLPENSLQDHRPTLDELLEEKKRREENLTRNGLL